MHRGSVIVSVVLLAGLALAPAGVAAEEAGSGSELAAGSIAMEDVYFSVGLAAAAAVTASFSIVAAGFAVGKIGAAALGSAAEHPELLTRSLLFVALAEGLAVLGFAVAMLLVMKIPQL
jgi:V/A-type H+/Na+-transporting ATPase subunit K